MGQQPCHLFQKLITLGCLRGTGVTLHHLGNLGTDLNQAGLSQVPCFWIHKPAQLFPFLKAKTGRMTWEGFFVICREILSVGGRLSVTGGSKRVQEAFKEKACLTLVVLWKSLTYKPAGGNRSEGTQNCLTSPSNSFLWVKSQFMSHTGQASFCCYQLIPANGENEVSNWGL